MNSLYNANADEGIIERQVFNNALKSYVIADSSKFNQKAFYHFYDLTEADLLITDSNFTADHYELYKQFIEIKLP